MNRKSTEEHRDKQEGEASAENVPQNETAAADSAQEPDSSDAQSAAAKPYDMAFRTLVQETPRLLIWFINEIFGKSYPDDAAVQPAATEYVLKQADGTKVPRTMDAHFGVRVTDAAGHSDQYHIEEESKYNAVMPKRMWEYSVSSADVKTAASTKDVTHVYFPASALLYLRPPAGQKDTMPIALHLRGENGQEHVAVHDVKVVTPHDYTLDELFEKRLYLLLPFYLFQYEKRLPKIEKAAQLRTRLAAEYENIRAHLEQDESDGVLDPYESWTVRETIQSVADALAAKTPKTRKEVTDMMHGPVLDYEAKRIHDAGIAEGVTQGIAQGIAEGITQGITQGRTEGEILGVIRTARAFGASYDQQVELLQTQLGISLPDANKAIAEFDEQSEKQ